MENQPFFNAHHSQNVPYQGGMHQDAADAPRHHSVTAQEHTTINHEQLQRFQRFYHILSLPMFPLYTDSEAIARQKEAQDRAKYLAEINEMKADLARGARPEPTITDKIGLKVLGAATGVSFFNANKMYDGGVKAAINFSAGMDALAAHTATRISNVVHIVRWASSPDAVYKPVIVDVLEIRAQAMEEKGAYIAVRANREVRVKVGSKYEKKIKRDGKWTKSVRGSCEIAVVEKGVGVFPLEVVLSRQMPMTTPDWVDVQKRFKKRWSVPNY